MTDINTAKDRLAAAEKIKDDFLGKLQSGLSLETYADGEYTIVDDGQDRWLIDTETYEQTVAEIVGDILDGAYDAFLDDPLELNVRAYDNLCTNGCVYSRIGLPSDESAIAALDVDDEAFAEILDALGLEYCLWDSDTSEEVAADELGISDEEYIAAIRESMTCDQVEGHIYVGGLRVYAA